MAGACRSAARDHRSGLGEPDWLFTIIGASFGPICGQWRRTTGYRERKWGRPKKELFRRIWSLAAGFVVGILPFLPIPAETKPYLQPAAGLQLRGRVCGLLRSGQSRTSAEAGFRRNGLSFARSILLRPIGANI